jgi:diaminohydroxyphosphoribosylaminopyrimidine deaminase/5-amino-6-(5-phosphoribosylamino)uracil reductase
VAAGLLGGELVDELAVVHAGIALGAEGRPMLGALGLERLAEAPRMRLAEVRAVGGDVVSRWVRG